MRTENIDAAEAKAKAAARAEWLKIKAEASRIERAKRLADFRRKCDAYDRSCEIARDGKHFNPSRKVKQ